MFLGLGLHLGAHLCWTPGGSGDAPPTDLTPAATGGVETLFEQGGKYYRVHTFGAGLGEFVASRDIANAERLLVAGGGGGGIGVYDGGGGGDGGQPIFVAGPLAAGTYPISVGTGGLGGSNSGPPENGATSAAFGDTAIGGGAGGHNRGLGKLGWGSGGSGARNETYPPVGPSGFNGGRGDNGGGRTPGGGSGAGGNGEDAFGDVFLASVGLGGPGLSFGISGISVEYSKGGSGKDRFAPHGDPPPLKWSSGMFRKTEETHGQQTTKARRDCHEVTAG